MQEDYSWDKEYELSDVFSFLFNFAVTQGTSLVSFEVRRLHNEDKERVKLFGNFSPGLQGPSTNYCRKDPGLANTAHSAIITDVKFPTESFLEFSP